MESDKSRPPYYPFSEQTLDQLHAELAHWRANPGAPGRDRYIRVCGEWIAKRAQEAAHGAR